MKTQKQQGGGPAPTDQPAPVRKKGAWWQKLKLGRAQARYAYVVSEGDVWFGRRTPDQRAFVWIPAEDFLGQAAANDEGQGNGN